MFTPEEVLILKKALMAYMDLCADVANGLPVDGSAMQASAELNVAQILWNKIQRKYPDAIHDER